jgi:5-methyltetrahydrofolate--homocysteine methyltransferase
MAIPNLEIIGERINPGYKSSKQMLDDEDIPGLQELAKSQVKKGADALTINVGERALEDPEYMGEVVRAVQNVVGVPLAFDFPNLEAQEVCLKTYDIEKAKGQIPIVNSISELRMEMLDLLKIRPFRLIAMASERKQNGEHASNRTADEVYDTTLRMARKILANGNGMTIDNLIMDVSVGAVAADTEGRTKMAVDAIRKIGEDPELKGIHMIVGLSNISIMLPTKNVNGSSLKTQIDSAFLTLTTPYGLDMILGTAGRNYRILSEDNPVLVGFKEALELGGIESVMRIQKLYQEE